MRRIAAILAAIGGTVFAQATSSTAPAAPAKPAAPLVTPEILDLSMQPPLINTQPGPEYSDEQRDFNMVIGIDRTPKGRLWAAWVSGGDSDKGYFVAATSDDQGRTWSGPRLVIDPPDVPGGLRRRILVGNFWTDPTGKLWLFFDQSMGYFDGRAGSWAITCENPDAELPVWSAPRRIWHGATLCKPLVVAGDCWLLPISLWTRDRIRPREMSDLFHELDPDRMAHVFISADRGETWKRQGGVLFPQSDFDEHMMVQLKDGRLWMLARTRLGLHESFSPDEGKTWSPPQPSPLMHINARHFLRKLSSGKLLLVKHGPIGQRTDKRSDLTAFLSDDDGKTWSTGLMLDQRTGVSYPDGLQAPDGSIYIIYDHNRSADREVLLACFTEADILAGRIESPDSYLRHLVNRATGKR